MKNIKKGVHPTNWIYLLVHALIFMIGLFIVIIDVNTIVTAIGSSIIAAGITGWVVFLYIRITQGISNQLTILNKFGFEDAFEARSVRIKEEYDTRLVKAQDSIDILGFGLRSLREDYLTSFPKWTRQAKVRILLLDPDFPESTMAYSLQRDKEENNSLGTIRNDVNEFLCATKELREATGENKYMVRLYKCLPSINIFRIDDELFWGPYLIGDQSRNCPTFLVQKGGILYNRYLRHFDLIWNDEKLSRNP